ncbi:MAG TPA: PDZ domain-containing protein [Phycisphaerae bacterium]|nr:PDZ domain-containing protein [Phycisphaerae bacterium]
MTLLRRWAVLTWVMALSAAGAQTTSPREAQPTRPAAGSQPATRPAPTQLTARQRLRKIAQMARRALALYEARDYKAALAVQKELVDLAPEDGRHWYNLACLQCRTGRTDEALQSLQQAVEKGYSELRHMERDDDLKALRPTEGYKRILAHRDDIQRRRAAKVYDALKKQMGEGYAYQIDHDSRLIFAANVDQGTLKEIREFLGAYAKAMRRQLFSHSFEQYVAVVVPKEQDSRRPFLGGYYNHANRTLVAKSIGMVLRHEFTHALHGADQAALGQRHPIWITEGLATLFETSEIRNGRVYPRHNHRLNILQRLLRRKRTIPFEKLFKLTHQEFMRQAVEGYPQSRYVMMYLHDKGVLRKWYDAYTAGFDEDRTGAAAMAEVLGRKLGEIEADWLEWAKTLKPPPLTVRPKQAYVGITMAHAVDGLRIARVVPGSGADKAGLKPGDVILRIDGQRMLDPGELVRLVTGHGVGDQLKVTYRREGKERSATVVLQAMPSDVNAHLRGGEPASRPAPRTQPATQP